MGIRRCIVVARIETEESAELVRARLDALVAFYRPLGEPALTHRHVPGARAVVGLIDYDGRTPELSAPVTFGAELPPGLRTTEQLLDAGATRLRSILGPSATAAIGARTVRLVTASGPPTMLYRSDGPGIQAWSTHAVAAAYVAQGRAETNGGVLAELLAARFVGADRTLVHGAVAVDSASLITISGSGSSTESFWPRHERWQLVDPSEAHALAADALLTTLDQRLAPYERLHLGLTGGLDSRVIAVALAEVGVQFGAFTFGDPDWDDVREAAALAARLGVPHERAPVEWTDDEAALRAARAAARASEGAIQLGIGRIAWPSGMTAHVTGGAGETGRTFYYRARAAAETEPGVDALEDALGSALLAQIPGAKDEARSAVMRSVADWIADARATTGLEGWRILDVVYAEQRVRRWLRGMQADTAGVAIPGFSAPDVQRALVSLPLAERASDGFHRLFLEERAVELLPDRPRPARPGAQLLTRMRNRMGRRPPALPELQRRWADHPRFQAWIADEVLGSAMLAGALGETWCRETRRGFLEGAEQATHNALLAAGPVALADELKALVRD